MVLTLFNGEFKIRNRFLVGDSGFYLGGFFKSQQMSDGELFILINIANTKAVKAPADRRTQKSSGPPPRTISSKSPFAQVKRKKFGFGRELTVKYYQSTQGTL